MYHGAGNQGNWNQQQQGNMYPQQMQQQQQMYSGDSSQTYRPQSYSERPNTYGYSVERRPDSSNFTSPPRMQTPGMAVRNPWEGQVRGPSPYSNFETTKMHPGYFKNTAGQSYPSGQYPQSQMDPTNATRSYPDGSVMSGQGRSVQMQGVYQQQSMPSGEMGYDAATKRQMQSQYASQMMQMASRNDQSRQTHLHQPGMEYNYQQSRVPGPHRYPGYGQSQYGSGVGSQQSYGHGNPQLAGQSAHIPANYQVAPTSMSYNHPNRYPNPGNNPGMMSPTAKAASPMRTMVQDASNRHQVPMNNMPGYVPRPGSRHTSYEGSAVRAPASMASAMPQQGQLSNAPNMKTANYSDNFNLDSLLDDPATGGGSLLQQLEDDVPGNAGTGSASVKVSAPTAPAQNSQTTMNVSQVNQPGQFMQQNLQPGMSSMQAQSGLQQQVATAGSNAMVQNKANMQHSMTQSRRRVMSGNSGVMSQAIQGNMYSRNAQLQSPPNAMAMPGRDSQLLSPQPSGQSKQNVMRSPQRVPMGSPGPQHGPGMYQGIGRSPQANMVGSKPNSYQSMQGGIRVQSPNRVSTMMPAQSQYGQSYQTPPNFGQSPQRVPMSSPPPNMTSPPPHSLMHRKISPNVAQNPVPSSLPGNYPSQSIPGAVRPMRVLNPSVQHAMSSAALQSPPIPVPRQTIHNVGQGFPSSDSMSSPPLIANMPVTGQSMIPAVVSQPQGPILAQSSVQSSGAVLPSPNSQLQTDVQQLPQEVVSSQSLDAISYIAPPAVQRQSTEGASAIPIPTSNNVESVPVSNIAPLQIAPPEGQCVPVSVPQNLGDVLPNSSVSAVNEVQVNIETEADEAHIGKEIPLNDQVTSENSDMVSNIPNDQKADSIPNATTEQVIPPLENPLGTPPTGGQPNSSQSKLTIPVPQAGIPPQRFPNQVPGVAISQAGPVPRHAVFGTYSSPRRDTPPLSGSQNQSSAVPRHPQGMMPHQPSATNNVYPSTQHSIGSGPHPRQSMPRYTGQNIHQSPQRGGPMVGPRPQGPPGHPRYQQGRPPQPGMHMPGQSMYPAGPVQQHGGMPSGPGPHRMPQSYPRPGFPGGPGQEGYRYQGQPNYPQQYGPQGSNVQGPYFAQRPEYRMQPPGAGIPRPQLMPQQFRGPPPRQMHPYPYQNDGNIPPGWHGPMKPMGPDQRPPVPTTGETPNKNQEPGTTKPARAPRRSKAKDGDGTPKPRKERKKREPSEKKEPKTPAKSVTASAVPATTPDGSTMLPEKPIPVKSTEKRKKKPPATFKLKKRRKKKGEESDDFDLLLPTAVMDNVEKRRSSRNVKRKQYTESYEGHLSDALSDEGVDNMTAIKGQLAGYKAEENNDDKLVVEKILDIRMRKVLKQKTENVTEEKTENATGEKTENATEEKTENATEEKTENATEDKTEKEDNFETAETEKSAVTGNPSSPDEEKKETDEKLSEEPMETDAAEKDDKTTEEPTEIIEQEDKKMDESQDSESKPVEASVDETEENKSDTTTDKTEENKSEKPEPKQENKPRERLFSRNEEITDPELYDEVEEYFVKYKNYSYLHCEWRTREEFQDKRVDGKIKRYKTKMAQMPEYLKGDIEDAFNPDFVEVERVLDVAQNEDNDSDQPGEKHYFIKWCSLPYEDSTWESASDIPVEKIEEFERRCKYRPPEITPCIPHKNTFHKLKPDDGKFRNNNELRDYQLEGINWLLFNWYNRRNCILADEMGLGKTIQSITFLQKIYDHGIEGPFLIVAPLSTICNWQREFASWTGINAVVYHGSQTSRDMIKTYEFLCRNENLEEMPGRYKMNAVITTYEMIVLENSHLHEIEWKGSIIDEAHRLKNQACKLADSLRSMQLDFKVLLTGTPLQNNVEELFALLNFLQPEVFDSSEAFMAEFGDLKNNSQVQKLQELLKPMMLRRLKEDVEKSLAPKEETIIEVELTNIQKKYYRAIMERNFEFLSKGAVTGNIPNLMNTMMELRKCCNHPYLIKGAEDKILSEKGHELSSLQTMIQSSGKLVLIDKLLPRLKSGGHRVLVFSQMVKCLDILEDYLIQSQYSYERIDGGIRGNDRQAAIDRYSRAGSEKFVFLLCTRAGGLGINLTAADTVIIFDSDWNPQNDLQAQARCHRIGQKKTVKIYRLITRNSYEREMFDKANLKLGLDKAVLQSISGRQDEVNQNAAPALSKQEVENLLKLGAYGAIMDEDDDSNKFCEEDIDQILSRRTHTITIAAGEKGSTFSKASFISGEEGSEISLNDPNFWEKWAKKADLDVERLTNNKLIIEEPRRRKQTRRFGGMTEDVEVLAEIGSDSDSDYDEKMQSKKSKKAKMKSWGKKDYFRVQNSLLTFGWDRWKHMMTKGGFPAQMKEKELETVCRAILMYCLKYYTGDEKIRTFMWNLITPANCSSANIISALEGLTTPVARGRKGRSAKEETKEKDSGYDQIAQEWIKEVDVNAIIQEESVKKHLQRHCNKILLRVRMLYFLRTEILCALPEDINEMTSENLKLNFPDMKPEALVPGWDFECDKNLLFGVHKHGFGKYSLIRADPKLCFLVKFGMPDEKSMADDMDDNGEEDAEDPEYKPTKLNFGEYSEFEDSPAGTPGTAPASPASSIDSTKDSMKENGTDEKDKKSIEKEKMDDMDNDDDQKENNESKSGKDEKSSDKDENDEENKDNKEGKTEKGENKKDDNKEEKKTLTWPSSTELNMRFRRIIACYQKQHKQIRNRLMNMDQNSPKNRMKEVPRETTHWTRREEADFYRTVSTFGVEYTKQGFSWTRFRQLAKLDKKSDRSLDLYYLAFKTMCERACGHKTPIPDEVANVNITKVTEERASRTLYRIELLNRIRLDVLKNKNFEENLKKCERSLDLPVWWKPGHHDKELLIGMDKHGVTRTEIHILNDTSLSFLKTMYEYEQKQYSQKRRKRHHSPEITPTISEKKKKGEEDSSDVKDEKSDETNEKSEAEKRLMVFNSSGGLVKEDDPLYINHIFNMQKWPKDRILIQRIEHVCYCVINGKWPISRAQEEAAFLKNQIPTMPTIPSPSPIINKPSSKSSTTASDSPKLLLDSKGHLLDEASSKILSIIAAQNREFKEDTNTRNTFKPKKQNQGDIMSSPKLPSSKKSEIQSDTKSSSSSSAAQSDALLNLCLSNSKFSETLQTLLKSDLSILNLPQKTLLSEAMSLSFQVKPEPPATKRSKEEFVPVKAEKAAQLSSIFGSPIPKQKKEEKGIMKKKIQKSRSGFISPAVLPPESRIPVYNPSEKKKLTGEDAPLNKDLADWLKDHPGFVVDYKSLRQKLSEDSSPTKESVSSSSNVTSSSSNNAAATAESKPKSTKSSSEHRKTPVETGSHSTTSSSSGRERERERTTSERKRERNSEQERERISERSSDRERERSERDRDRTSERERERSNEASARAQVDRSLEQAINSHQASLLNQSLINPSAGLLNALYGNSPEMAALLASQMIPGLPPFLPDPSGKDSSNIFHQSSSSSASASSGSQSHQKKHKNHTHSSKSSTTRSSTPQPQFSPDQLAALFGLGGMPSATDAASLAALFGGYPPPTSKDTQKQLKQLFEQPMAQFDPKAAALGFGGMNIPPFFPGMPAAMNPLLYGMYANPELAAMPDLFHPAHMSAMLENEYPKLKNAENLNALQELLGVQNSLMANIGFDINNPEFQKFVRAQEALQQQQTMAPPMGKTSTPNQSDFDDSLRSVYQQLHSSSLQKEYESRKKDRHDPDRKKSASEDDTPVDLRRSGQSHKK